jgi:uncharacterized membrane protein
MKQDTKVSVLFVLSIAGVLFSGYLSGVKFFTQTCALSEPCPYFLGYPACYYGFAMFLTLFIISGLLFVNKINPKTGLTYMSGVSLLGILFAGYFTLRELPILFVKGFGAYILGLPTCALGMIFFVIIFILALYARAHRVI